MGLCGVAYPIGLYRGAYPVIGFDGRIVPIGLYG